MYNPVGTKNFMSIQDQIMQQLALDLQKKQLEQQAEQAKTQQILQGASIAASFAGPLLGAAITGAQAANRLKTTGQQALDQISATGEQQQQYAQIVGEQNRLTRNAPTYESPVDTARKQAELDLLKNTSPYTVEAARLANQRSQEDLDFSKLSADSRLRALENTAVQGGLENKYLEGTLQDRINALGSQASILKNTANYAPQMSQATLDQLSGANENQSIQNDILRETGMPIARARLAGMLGENKSRDILNSTPSPALNSDSPITTEIASLLQKGDIWGAYKNMDSLAKTTGDPRLIAQAEELRKEALRDWFAKNQQQEDPTLLGSPISWLASKIWKQ